MDHFIKCLFLQWIWNFTINQGLNRVGEICECKHSQWCERRRVLIGSAPFLPKISLPLFTRRFTEINSLDVWNLSFKQLVRNPRSLVQSHSVKIMGTMMTMKTMETLKTSVHLDKSLNEHLFFFLFFFLFFRIHNFLYTWQHFDDFLFLFLLSIFTIGSNSQVFFLVTGSPVYPVFSRYSGRCLGPDSSHWGGMKSRLLRQQRSH